MNNGPNLWWVQDSESKEFSTLPAGPLLLPTLILIGIAGIFRALTNRPLSYESLAGSLTETEYWKRKKARYDEYMAKILADGWDSFTLSEMNECNKLQKYLLNPTAHGRR